MTDNILQGIGYFLFNERKRMIFLAEHGFYRGVNDKKYLLKLFHAVHGQKLDLNNPKTFNEKLQWLKLYDRQDIYTTLVDKYEVKKYVGNIIGDEYIIPTLGVWDSFDDIDFDLLPEKFVLKCTHDSGGLVICENKALFDRNAAKKKIEECLNDNYYWFAREWPYKNVKPRIIAEKYMVNTIDEEGNNELDDYKIWCFNGVPKITLVCTGRYSKGGVREDFFDEEWNHLELKRPKHANSQVAIPKPQNYELMKQIASKLAGDIGFKRIDLYQINGKIYFGEITFYPESGFEKFEPEEWDLTLGSWVSLPPKSGEFKND